MLHTRLSDAIGNTPLVKLHRLGADLPCQLWAKCEFLNPGGSIKDRISKAMIEDAEASGRIRPGDTLIEATSGNTGIGLAMVGASKGYQVILVMPEKMSLEKQRIAEALGAKIVRTPSSASYDSPESHISVAKQLAADMDGGHVLDQYNNSANPMAHQMTTAKEILEDLEGQVHMVVSGVGTGGTITGISTAMADYTAKNSLPPCQIVAADPYGSILAPGSKELSPYEVEGIGYDFIPEVLKRHLVDHWVKTHDRDSFKYARLLAQKEGILCGGSSGAVVQAALQQAGKLKAGQNCVLILADGVRNYLSKFLDMAWLKRKDLD